MPTIEHAGVRQPGRDAAEENENAVKPWARVLARRYVVDGPVDAVLGAVLDGVRPDDGGADHRLRRSPPSITPTWRRTTPYAAASLRWK